MELGLLLDLLREKGVARYEADGISVSFHSHEGVWSAAGRRWPRQEDRGVIDEPKIPAAPEAAGEDLCTCGHPILTDHMPTGCVHGCAIETCGVPTGKAPPDA